MSVDDVLLQLIREQQQQLPFALQVDDLQKLLPHGQTKIYQMLERGEIPGKKVAGRWFSPRDLFLAWFYGEEED